MQTYPRARLRDPTRGVHEAASPVAVEAAGAWAEQADTGREGDSGVDPSTR